MANRLMSVAVTGGIAVVVGVVLGCSHAAPLPKEQVHVTDARWASSRNLEITLNGFGKPPVTLTRGHRDFKPSWSGTGRQLTFFRLMSAGRTFDTWKTKLCVIGSDGSGFRELSSGAHADFNPTWTRDGTERVIFNRYAAHGWESNEIYLISPGGSPGEEVLVSDPRNGYEWAFSGLKDGRLFIDRVSFHGGAAPTTVRSFLLTPRPGGAGVYQEIQRPTRKLWHKLSLSPGETKVAYMLDQDGDMSTYRDVVLYVADFDATARTVTNPVAITDLHPTCIHEYPRWSADESLVIYDSNCSGTYQMYAYRLSDGTTSRISADPWANDQFGNFEGVPK